VVVGIVRVEPSVLSVSSQKGKVGEREVLGGGEGGCCVPNSREAIFKEGLVIRAAGRGGSNADARHIGAGDSIHQIVQWLGDEAIAHSDSDIGPRQCPAWMEG